MFCHKQYEKSSLKRTVKGQTNILQSWSFSTVWHRIESSYIKNYLNSIIPVDPLASLDVSGQQRFSIQEPYLTRVSMQFITDTIGRCLVCQTKANRYRHHSNRYQVPTQFGSDSELCRSCVGTWYRFSNLQKPKSIQNNDQRSTGIT